VAGIQSELHKKGILKRASRVVTFGSILVAEGVF